MNEYFSFMANYERILDSRFYPTDADLTIIYSQTVGVNFQSIDVGVVRYEYD